MNVEDILEQTLTERAEKAPPGGEVLQRALAPSRVSRRWWPAAVSVVAAAGVVTAAVVALGGDGRTAVAPSPSVAASPTWSVDGLAAYGPTRTLVYRGVELLVPASWRGLHVLACGGVTRDAVVTDELLPRERRACLAPDRFKHGYVELRQPYHGEAPKGDAFDLAGESAIARVSKPYECDTRHCFGPPDGTVSGTLTVPDRDVVIEVHTLNRSLTEAILASVHLRDMSEVTVPRLGGLTLSVAERRLVRLGLSPYIARRGGHVVLHSYPEAGEPAPADGRVSLALGYFRSEPR